ncbi:hypothetical protein JKP88DRAFT_255554, partial [Tribonema minus]
CSAGSPYSYAIRPLKIADACSIGSAVGITSICSGSTNAHSRLAVHFGKTQARLYCISSRSNSTCIIFSQAHEALLSVSSPPLPLHYRVHHIPKSRKLLRCWRHLAVVQDLRVQRLHLRRAVDEQCCLCCGRCGI